MQLICISDDDFFRMIGHLRLQKLEKPRNDRVAFVILGLASARRLG